MVILPDREEARKDAAIGRIATLLTQFDRLFLDALAAELQSSAFRQTPPPVLRFVPGGRPERRTPAGSDAARRR